MCVRTIACFITGSIVQKKLVIIVVILILKRGESAKGKSVAHKVLNYLPITPRLQRLYLSSVTAENMRWHKEGVRDKEGVIVHPADGDNSPTVNTSS
jgi:hypothetical protein